MFAKPATASAPLVLVRQGQPAAAIVIAPTATPFLHWLAGELQRYLLALTGAQIPILGSDDLANAPATLLALGLPQSNPLAAQLLQQAGIDLARLPADSFVLQPGCLGARPVLAITGRDERAAMYAAYDLLERLGICFQLTGDVIPQRQADLAYDSAAVCAQPDIARRGLHVRHFVVPWMGVADWRKLIDQMVKLKHNYLEFFWYVGGPWVQYSYQGEKKLLGDIQPVESGFLAWRSAVGAFTAKDVVVGREHFHQERVCAPEFAHCRTSAEAYAAAREYLNQVIDYAHQRKLEIWLGKGDCPGVVPNLGRRATHGHWSRLFGRMISPGDPAGGEIWQAALQAMIDSYPRADGHWLWLAELYFHAQDQAAADMVRRYEHLRPLIPGLDQLKAMGYDQYFRSMTAQQQFESDIGLVHYAQSLISALAQKNPQTKLGVAMLGRSYLFPALDAILPKNVPLQSMESCVVWNRSSRVPMENYAAIQGRELLVVPRLDDDESEFGLQFNNAIYERDRVVGCGRNFGVNGVAPQVGKTRGLEQNARFLAEGAWEPELTAQRFYQRYALRLFGDQAGPLVGRAFALLQENELLLGLKIDFQDVGTCFQGIDNFRNYADTRDINQLKAFGRQAQPFQGPRFADWDVTQPAPAPLIRSLGKRHEFFGQAMELLGQAGQLLDAAQACVPPGAKAELRYLLTKTLAFQLHLQTLRALMEAHFAYDAAFRTPAGDGRLGQLEQALQGYQRAAALAGQTAEISASYLDDPSETYILFRYNVRFLLPLREFCRFIANVVAFHRGEPYWEKVRWEIIDPPMMTL